MLYKWQPSQSDVETNHQKNEDKEDHQCPGPNSHQDLSVVHSKGVKMQAQIHFQKVNYTV